MTFKECLSIKIRKHIQEIATMTKRVEREREKERDDEIEEKVSYMLPKVLCSFCTFSFESLFSILKVSLYA